MKNTGTDMTPGTQLPLDIRLRDDATAANYIGEAGHRLLTATGIVYLWGESGTGRSHLLQAACHNAGALGSRAIYLVEVTRYAPDVLYDLEQLELVCVDDIHQVVGHTAWETALFHLVNAVRDRKGTLLLSADRPAARLDVGLADLKSRLLAAHTIQTDVLDDAAKLEVLQQKASRQGIRLSEEVCRFIMSRSARDMRSLVDLLARLEVETLRSQRRLTVPFVKQVLDL